MSISRTTSWLVVLFVLTPVAALALTVVFEQGLDGYEGIADTSIFSELPDNGGGGTDGIFSGTTLQLGDRRALIRVDLSEIPPGSTVVAAQLELAVSMSGGNFGDIAYSLHRVTRGWGAGTEVGPVEGGFGAPADTGSATWDAARHGVELWDLMGGDYLPTPSATGVAGPVGTVASWSGPGLVADVQAWVDDPSANFGWILVSGIEGEQQRVKKFHSSEAEAERPRLTVVIAEEDFDTDVNGDGVTNILDLQAIINVVLEVDDNPLADVNLDGVTNILDIFVVVTAILQ